MKVVFFGSPEFAVPCLEATARNHEIALVVTQPDRPAGRGRMLTPAAVKVVAQKAGWPVFSPTKLREPAVAERLRALEPDVFVVVAYGRILPPALLEVPRLGPWNVHASLLPAYRGAAPIQWAIIRGERQTGVCVMRMEEGLDTGPVADCRTLPIEEHDTAGTLSPRLAAAGADLLVEVLEDIAAGRVQTTAQDHARATLAPILRKEDGLLDLHQPARLVSAQARGVDPWPGAALRLAEETLKVFSPEVVFGQGQPGEVLGVGPGLIVACGSDAVSFRELQFPGRRRLAAQAALAGHPITPGTRLLSKTPPGKENGSP